MKMDGNMETLPGNFDSEAKDTPGRGKLRSWLNRTLKIEMTDGRILVGSFLCTDRDANVILGNCCEYLGGDEQTAHEDSRMLGLVMVPGRHIVTVQIDEMPKPQSQFFLWSNRTLAKVATYGAILSVSSAFYMKSRIEDRLKDQPYFKTAIRHLEEHPGAVKFLGKPIKMGKLNLEDGENNFCYEEKAQFQVDVKGTLGKGTYYFWSEYENDSKSWILKRSELELKDQPDKRLVIKNDP